MNSHSLQHDHAVAIAAAVVEIFYPLLREEERREAFQEIYARVLAGLQHYELKADRTQARLHPTEN